MLRRIKRSLLPGLKWCVSGEQFKRYTRPNPPAAPGPRLRIAICYLIPLLGDVVMLFPLIDALRGEHPDAEITAFVAGQGRILGMHPGIDRIYERPKRTRGERALWPVGDIASLWIWWRRQLRHLRFDVCVMLRGGADPYYSAHLAWLLGGRDRVGYSAAIEPERRGSDLGASPLLTREITRLGGVHEVERGEEILRLAGLLAGTVETTQPSPSLMSIAGRPEGVAFLRQHAELAAPYFIVSPGASRPLKEWPEERYAEVALTVAREHQWTPVIIGGPDVSAIGARLAERIGIPTLNLAGRTGFAELAAVCAGAQCFIGNDSGTGHLAGALGVPSVIISSYPLSSPGIHQTSPLRTHPAGPFYAVVQPQHPLAPCAEECIAETSHCIEQVAVTDVWQSVEALLARSRASGSVTSDQGQRRS